MAIAIYPQDCRDFSTNGLGLLTPIECSVTAELNGAFELKVVQPIDDTLRWAQLETGCIVKAPVPVRDSPVYEEVEEPETAVVKQRKIYKVHNTSVGVYMRSGPGRSYKNYGYLKNGAEVVLLEITNSSWYHVCVVKGGRECYMASKYLTYDRTESETVSNGKITGKRVVRPMQAQEQLFRVYKVEPDSEAGTVTASARHIFYDLMCDVIEGECELENVGFAEAVQTVWSKRMNPDDGFALRVLPGDYGSVSGNYGWRNPVEALLDGEDGLIAQGGALLVLDNYNIYLLPDAPRYSGVSIRRGKQLSGVKVTMNSDSVVTRVIPCGKDKDDKELLLEGTKYVDSPHIGDYPFPRVKKIDYDVKVASKAKDADGEKTFKTVAAAREKLAALAAAEFSENGLDAPEYGLKVDFLPLENTAEYADYAALQALFLGDTVDVVDSLVRVRARLRVTGYGDWNAVTRRYGSLTLGEVESVERTVYGSQIPNGSVSGSKLIPGSVTGGVLRNMTVEYAKISTAAIEQLSADAITALIGRFNEISTGKLTADALYTAYGEMLKLVATEITSENIQTDELAAELARITVLIAGTAAFDAATIRHLVSEAMNLEYGVAGQVFIKNLAVEYAQMVGAAIGKLCIRASDGKYYLLDVGADGRVTAAETTVTDSEIEAGQTSGGSVIVETSITAASLTTTNLLATYALINKIDAARIDVDELVARKTFTDALYTSRIYGGKSLELIVGDVSKAQRAADTAKTAADRAQSSVDNLAVGGRNYIRNGNFSAGENHWAQWGSPITKEVVEMSGKHWLHIAGNADLEFQGVSQVLPFMRNEPLAVSFTAYASAENTVLMMIIHQMGLNNDPQIYNNYTLGTAPKRYFKTFTSADDATKATFKLMLGPRKSANDVYITDIKFERGNKATDWTPAPEDTNSRIDDARTAADRAQSDIDGMAIGGRNLVLKSDAEKGPARNNQYDIAANRFIAGEYYACSVEMKSPSERSVDVYLNDDSGAGRINIPFSQWLGVKLTPDWVRYSFVYKADRDFDYPGKDRIVLRAYGTTADAADISVRRVKLEKGNKATDWTAAPEDTDGKIDNAQTAADNAQTTANGAQTAAVNAQSTADNAQTAADNAQTAANGAQTAADNAQTTADNAQTAANGAQTAADNAQNTASAARTATEQLQVSVEGVLEQTVDGVRIGRRINGQTAPNSLFAGPDGIDVCVENRAVSSFRSDYIKLLGMQIRVPEGIGGLIISSFDAPEPERLRAGSGSAVLGTEGSAPAGRACDTSQGAALQSLIEPSAVGYKPTGKPSGLPPRRDCFTEV